MTERDETTRPLTAEMVKRLRAEVADMLEPPAWSRMHIEPLTLLALLDALDAREAQTCGTCKCAVKWNEGLTLCEIGVRRDADLMINPIAFGCNQWAAKEPK